MPDDPIGSAEPAERRPNEYEPPRVEKVLTVEDLEREAQYAGRVSNN
jgi:hypothetical protein